jgi:hypothetical protein
MADLLHGFYDPVKAHQYYLRTRKLKGRKKGSALPAPSGQEPGRQPDPAVRARKRREIAARIANLEQKLNKLEALIKKKETEEKQASKKSAAKKERSAKEAAKPDTAAEKAKKAREAKQWRAKNQSKVKSQSKEAPGKSGGSSKTSSAEPKKSSGASVKELKSLATKVRGQIATAKTRLRSL